MIIFLCRFCLRLKTQLTTVSLERKSSHGAERRGDKERRREEILTFILFIFTILAFILIKYQFPLVHAIYLICFIIQFILIFYAEWFYVLLLCKLGYS